MADNMLRSDPLADPINDLLLGMRKFKLTTLAVELGIFDDMETLAEPATVAALGRKLHYQGDVLERLLDSLVCIKLMEKSKNREGVAVYKNAPCTQKYLTRSKRPSMIPVVMMEGKMCNMIDTLPHALKAGTTGTVAVDMMNGKSNPHVTTICTKTTEVKKNSLNNNNNNHNNNNNNNNGAKPPLDELMVFMSCMDGMAAPCTASLARAFDLSGHKSAVDLGGGSGLIGYELTKVYSGMHVSVFDLPHVVQLSKKLQPEDTKKQVTFVAGDFFTDKLPPADLCILSHVVHDWDREKLDLLLKKVFDTLPPGGCLLVLEKLMNEEKDGPEQCVTMDLLMSLISKGKERTGNEYKALLEKHGFKNTQIRRIAGNNTYDAMLTRKPF